MSIYVMFADAVVTEKIGEDTLAVASPGDLKRSISRHMWIVNSLCSKVTDFLAYNGHTCDWDDLVILYEKINDISKKTKDAIDFMFNVDWCIQRELSKKWYYYGQNKFCWISETLC